MSRRASLLGACILSLLFGALPIITAAPAKVHGVRHGIRHLLKLEKDYIARIDKDDCPLKKGVKVDVYLLSGDKLAGSEIAEIQLGKPKHAIKVLTVTTSKGAKRKLMPNTLAHIAMEDRIYDVVQDQEAKSFVLLDLTRRDELAKERLAKTGHSLWTDPTPEERQESIADAKKLFKRVQDQFSNRVFNLHETSFYLFYTDMPTEQVANYVANLDEMYQQLCLAFGILPDRNIWRGKCPVVVFQDRESFLIFERTMMNVQNAEGAQGLYHGGSDGSVVVSAFSGNDPAYFASVLVHETAHGFVHRLRSNVHIESWLNEGIADWIAGVAVPSSTAVPRRRSDAIAQMRSTRTMGGFFNPEKRFSQTEYGMASSLVDFMLQTDSNLYRAFLMAIKDGYSPEEALKLTYDSTPRELVQSFGASIGVPDLTP